ncbi:uncharacterized protein LOC107003848 [Solanum pennellii]|uniref:Uncharacterized protein LOC107003848 n=1 Tax=Solanum pennellii TaxID=28526 RepID=A0ABM1FJ35_SOLPN|nr:uncharacterized protein LOC107003848 [Solanum pennellii]
MQAQVNQQNVQRENPPIRSIADMLLDFTRMNPPIFTGSKTFEDPQEFMDEVQNILGAMGATDTKKAELASNKLKDVEQTWCKMWQDRRDFGEVSVTWEMSKTAFLERFFPREMRKYAASLVSYNRHEMNRFLTGIAEDLKEECRAVMLHDTWTFQGLWSMSSKWRKAERGSTLRLKKGLSHQGESSSSKGLYDKNSESKVKRNNGVDTPQERPPCRKCGKLHGGECMVGTNAC